MKKFYIYIQQMDATYYSSKTSVMAKNEEEALDKYIELIKRNGSDNDGNIFEEDDKWRLYATENEKYDKEYYKWLKDMEEEEILWRRPIEL